MLYTLGAIELDTFPLAPDTMTREASADIAKKPVIEGLKNAEFMGEGDDTITLSGHLFPSKIGGLVELEALHEMRRNGAKAPLLRGDGRRMGTFQITRIRETHKELLRDGVGAVIKFDLVLEKVPSDSGTNRQTISSLLSLFGVLG